MNKYRILLIGIIVISLVALFISRYSVKEGIDTTILSSNTSPTPTKKLLLTSTTTAPSTFTTVTPNPSAIRTIYTCNDNKVFSDEILTKEQVDNCFSTNLKKSNNMCSSALSYATKYNDFDNIATIKDASTFLSSDLSNKAYDYLNLNIQSSNNICYTFYTNYQKWASTLDSLSSKPCGSEPKLLLQGDNDLTQIQKTYAESNTALLDTYIEKLQKILANCDTQLTVDTVDYTAFGKNPIFKISGTAPNQKIHFTLAQGNRGPQGDVGSDGVAGLSGAQMINGEDGLPGIKVQKLF